MLARAAGMGLAVQHAACIDQQFVNLVFACFFGGRQDADAAAGAEIVDRRHLSRAQNLDLRGRWRAVQKAREIHL